MIVQSSQDRRVAQEGYANAHQVLNGQLTLSFRWDAAATMCTYRAAAGGKYDATGAAAKNSALPVKDAIMGYVKVHLPAKTNVHQVKEFAMGMP